MNFGIEKCPVCGKQFKRQTNASRYCSKECQLQHKKEYNAEYRKKSAMELQTCSICGKQYLPEMGWHRRHVCPDCEAQSYIAQVLDEESHRQPIRRLTSKEDANIELKVIAAMARDAHVSYGEMARRIDADEVKIWSVEKFNRWKHEIHKKKQKEKLKYYASTES